MMALVEVQVVERSRRRARGEVERARSVLEAPLGRQRGEEILELRMVLGREPDRESAVDRGAVA
jgi:hypothetical protein